MKTIESRPAELNDLINIENHITSTYSGRPGCMCGCNGTYTDAVIENGVKKLARANKMMITRMRKAIQDNSEPVQFQSWSIGENKIEACLFIESDTRNNTLYLELNQK